MDRFGRTTSFQAVKRGLGQSSQQFGKSIHNSNFRDCKRSTINSIDKHVEAMEMPKKFKIALRKAAREEKKRQLEEKKQKAKEEKEAAEAAGIKLPKKPRVNKFAYPTPEALPPPKPLTVSEALLMTKSWNAANVIGKKFASGTMTTAGFNEKTAAFE